MDETFKHLLLGLLVIAALIGLVCSVMGCTINVERIQVGPDSFYPSTQPADIEQKIWSDFDHD